MWPRRCSLVLKTLLIINVLAFLYFFFGMNANETVQTVKEVDVWKSLHHNDKTPVTAVFLEYEFFHNDLKSSVLSLVKSSPHTPIVIIAESEPYPPLKLESDLVEIIRTNPHPNVSRYDRDPLRFITTNYVAFMPDGIQTKSIQALQLIIEYIEKSTSADGLVLPYGDGSTRNGCEQLKVDLRRWTLKYTLSLADSHGKPGQGCQSHHGDSMILLKTRLLKELTDPFVRPFNDGFFIQAALRKWNLIYLDGNHLFESGGALQLADQHTRMKLKMKHESRLAELYNRFGIKKVIHSDSTEQFFGCSKHTSRCFGTIINDMPSFIIEGRWTPPCCLRNLRVTTRHVFEIFEEYNVKYWLEGGSLLGAVRHGDIIPWDYDVDLGMFMQDIPNLEPLRLAEKDGKYIDAEQFVWVKATEGEFFRVHFSESNHLHVDIFPFYEKDGIMTKNTWFKNHPQDTEFPAHFLNPLERLDFVGKKALVPNNYVKFLEMKFGAGVVENPRYPDTAPATS